MTVPNRKLRVGVTLHVRNGFQSIWENGIFQNCAFLVQLLNNSPVVAQAVLVVNHATPVPPNDAMMLKDMGLEIMALPQAMTTLDAVIEMSEQLPQEWVRAFCQRGGRYAWMRVGNDYFIDIERAMFDKPSAGLCNDKPYSAVWTLPQYQNSCRDYFAITTRAPVRIVPHLWTPYFFDQGIASLPQGVHYGYQPGRPRWRVCSFEPNVCMVKTSVIPMLACEEAYRAKPSFLECVRVCNTLHIKNHANFVHFAKSLDIVQHGLATFEGRFAVYEFMAHHGDCVVSHHWENGQNYLYYELLYGGYPLVHNSEFIKNQGYYYPDFDCQEAGSALLRAYTQHDANLSTYQRQARNLLRTLGVDHPNNISIYTRELLRLFEESAA